MYVHLCLCTYINGDVCAQNQVLLQAEKEGKESARRCHQLQEALTKAQENCSALEKEASAECYCAVPAIWFRVLVMPLPPAPCPLPPAPCFHVLHSLFHVCLFQLHASCVCPTMTMTMTVTMTTTLTMIITAGACLQKTRLLLAEKEGQECARVCKELKGTLTGAQERCDSLEKEVTRVCLSCT
jgi:hypothetical protein